MNVKTLSTLRFYTLLSLLFLLTPWLAPSPSVVWGQSPRFEVPELEREMRLMQSLHDLHHGPAFTNCTLWDGWLPQATLWVDPQKRVAYRDSFLQRRIASDGYVAMQQHRGLAHSDGWPFPAYQQSTGKGWHFSIAGDGWGVQQLGLKQTTSTAGWESHGVEFLPIDPARGLGIRILDEDAWIATPSFQCGTIVAPFARLEWECVDSKASGTTEIEWRFANDTWKSEHSMVIPNPSSQMAYENVPLYKHPNYGGLLQQYRLRWKGMKGATITLKSLITAIDTRHPITNSLFIRGSSDYFLWTGDRAFLRLNIERMRHALAFALAEFDVRQTKHVRVSWVGHSGESGLTRDENGRTKMKPGIGVGNNYWDLLPFGGDDAIATMYLCDAIDQMVAIESWLETEKDETVSQPPADQTAAVLKRLAEEIRSDFQKRFWDSHKGRFVGWVDLTGKSHDYGFTFVNLEAIHYNMATSEQATSILDWIDGKRIVDGDTSQGSDIYHWRFAPRATTLRNVETYMWAWNSPASIPWGYQVQDGGAVLGFSYFDLQARLKTNGPDDAWNRLKAILEWYEEVQSEGGYRAYYAVPGRGTLQGGGPPGGLGMDHEFMESVLVPQIMLYGFLGFEPNASDFRVRPRLPSDWKSLTIRGIHYHQRVMDITADRDGNITVTDAKSGPESK